MGCCWIFRPIYLTCSTCLAMITHDISYCSLGQKLEYRVDRQECQNSSFIIRWEAAFYDLGSQHLPNSEETDWRNFSGGATLHEQFSQSWLVRWRESSPWVWKRPSNNFTAITKDQIFKILSFLGHDSFNSIKGKRSCMRWTFSESIWLQCLRKPSERLKCLVWQLSHQIPVNRRQLFLTPFLSG